MKTFEDLNLSNPLKNALDDLGIPAGKTLALELSQFGLGLIERQAGSRQELKPRSAAPGSNRGRISRELWVVAGNVGASAYDRNHGQESENDKPARNDGQPGGIGWKQDVGLPQYWRR